MKSEKLIEHYKNHGYQGLSVLKLNVKDIYFEVMKTGEKPYELRSKSKWIESRLFNKDGTKRHYDLVEIRSGYGKNRPFIICDYFGFTESESFTDEFENGLTIDWQEPHYNIEIPFIIDSQNIT